MLSCGWQIGSLMPLQLISKYIDMEGGYNGVKNGDKIATKHFLLPITNSAWTGKVTNWIPSLAGNLQ